MKRRKEIYEALHPETKQGGLPGKPGGGKGAKTETVSSFADDVAMKTGLTPRTIRQYVQIATNLSDEAKAVIRETPLADRKRDLLAISRLPRDGHQERPRRCRRALWLHSH